MFDPTTAPSHAELEWEMQKSRIRIRFPFMNEADMDFDETNREAFFKRLQLKGQLTKQALRNIIDTM